MRTTLWTGCALIVAGVLVVLMSSGLDLELESTALMGAAIGAVLALVPDRTPLVRVVAFLGGFIAAWIGYLIRAALLPDTAGGRAVAVGIVIAVCVGLAIVALNKLPLWGFLLGAAALAGGYEASYAAAPSEVVDTSLTGVTTTLFTVAVGFLATALVAPLNTSGASAAHGPVSPHRGDHQAELDTMETA